MENYNPLFSSITKSSIWRCDWYVKLAWVTILAEMDYRSHIIETNPGLLGWAAGISPEQAAEALALFQAPDAFSRSTVEEGRRLKRLEGNRYLVVNGQAYSQKMKEFSRKAYDATRKAKSREAKQKPRQEAAPTPFKETPLVYESSAASGRFQKPGLDEVKLACAKCGLPESEAERFINYHESAGWLVGKKPMKSWQHALAGTWKSNWQERNQQQAALPKKKEISVFDSL